MNRKLTSKELAKFEAERDVWQEVLDGVGEIKAGGGKRKRARAIRSKWRSSPFGVRTTTSRPSSVIAIKVSRADELATKQ